MTGSDGNGDQVVLQPPAQIGMFAAVSMADASDPSGLPMTPPRIVELPRFQVFQSAKGVFDSFGRKPDPMLVDVVGQALGPDEEAAGELQGTVGSAADSTR